MGSEKEQRLLERGDMICLGASAGGLEALERFFRRLPNELDYTFVLIQHLSPDYKSVMSQLLGRYTHLRNVVVEDGSEPQAGMIHLIPPGMDMIIKDGVFRLKARQAMEQHLPIDLFLNSMVAEKGDTGSAIIFSGTGSDGTKGAKAVNLAGGMVLVQEPQTAKFDGMPMSAIHTGVADYVASPEALADFITADSETMMAMMANPSNIGNRTKVNPSIVGSGEAYDAGDDEPTDPHERVLKRLSERFNIDFSMYKEATIDRRIQRRMQLHEMKELHDYSDFLNTDPTEVDHLYHDLLIGVTEFFRDPEAFAVLAKDYLPSLLENHPIDQEFRVWVAGCATGEEAYSLAITLDKIKNAIPGKSQLSIRVFATDIHRGALKHASSGFYSSDRLEKVSGEILEKYFNEVSGGWTVRPFLRRMITFAPHNLLHDPPFLHMNLVSCRNLLIYFMKDAQKRVLLQFAAALELDGILYLGSSESMPEARGEFSIEDNKNKIFRKSQNLLPGSFHGLFVPREGKVATYQPKNKRRSSVDWMTSIYPELMASCMPPGLLVSESGELLHTFGGAGKYLNFSGPLNTDISYVLTGNLRVAVTTALERARKQGDTVHYSGVQSRLPGETSESVVNITIIPVQDANREAGESRRFYFVRFSEGAPEGAIANGEVLEVDDAVRLRIEALERELYEARENLQTTVEELETSNEELQATNEELLASNEELQSSNEELQSVNEELHSVNAEYQQKNIELEELNDDMQNLMSCTGIGTIFLDRQLRVRRYTPAAQQLFYLRDLDVGRPIREIRNMISGGGDLLRDIEDVIDRGTMYETEVMTESGEPFLQRLHPYRDGQQKIQGVVITYVELALVKEQEEKRREADLLRAAILRSMSANIAVIDSEGLIIDVNDGWRQFALANGAEDASSLGIGSNYIQACEHVAADASDDASRKAAIEGIRHVIERKQTMFELEYPCDAPLEPRWFQMRVTPLNREGGGAVIAHTDISERKRAEIVVQESERRLRAVFNATDAMVYVSDLNTCKILYANDYTVNQFGDVVGKTCWESLQKDKKERCHNCRSKDLLDADGNPTGVKTWEVKNERNGRWYECRDQAIIWFDQRYARLTVATDITERIEMERELREHRDHLDNLVKSRTNALRESEALFSALANATEAAIWQCDADGRVNFVNQTWKDITGLTLEDAQQGKWEAILHPDDVDRYMQTSVKGRDRRLSYENEFRARVANGDYRWFFEKVAPRYDESGTFAGVIGTSVDVTELKTTQQRLIEVNERLENEIVKAQELQHEAEMAGRAKSRFMANMSHEIRTPMNGVIGMSSLLVDSDLSPRQKHYAEVIRDSGELLMSIINDILDLSKIESGTIELVQDSFHLKSLVDSVANLIKFKAEEKQLQVRCEVSDDVPPMIHVDGLRLQQVLLNLASNAVKFTEKGEVVIKVTLFGESHDQIRFSVIDTGIGIPDDRLQSVFEEFIQADSNITRRYGGTGLGLAISQRLIELMNGTIKVRSEVGKGSEFWFSIPVKPSEGAEKSGARDLGSGANSNELPKGLRVLLVEDNEINAMVAGEMLKLQGASVVHASDGQAAIDLLRQDAFDVVLMDVQMPVMDGLTASRKIRSGEAAVLNPDVPIVALTANAMQEDRDECKAAGMSDYLSKPVTPDSLASVLSRLM